MKHSPRTISMKHCVHVGAGLLLLLAIPACGRKAATFPPTEKRPVSEEYYGVKIVDNYRWLDDLKDPVVRKWNDTQNAFSRSYFDRFPFLATLGKRVKEVTEEESSSYFALVVRRKLFALKFQPPKNQPFIVTLDSPDDMSTERVVVDPNELNPNGTTAIDWFVPSKEGRLVAASLSENGSEDGSVHVFDVSTGKKLPDIIPRAQYPTGGGSLEWNNDGTGFFYTRYPQGEERPKEDANFYQEVYFHRLGSPSSEDTYILGKEFPRIAENRIATTDDGQHMLVSVANGDGGEFAHYLRGPSGRWVQITQFSDGVTSAQFGPNETLYLLTGKDAPKRKILAVPISRPALAEAKVIVPESDPAISQFLVTAERLYVADVVGGPSRVRVFDLDGKQLESIKLKPISSVRGLVRLKGDEILFSSETYLEPQAWYQYDPGRGEVLKTALAVISTVNFNDCEVIRELAESRDGTKIPLNIIRRNGTDLNGKNPAILYGYGGFGLSEVPSFDPTRRIWLEQGGVYAIANLRGGGEFGEAWHSAGKLTKKQNVFNDFAACAQYLIDKKYTNPAKLAIEGGSNGGLLMGAALTQHPELFRAVVSYVGIYDMLRVELFPNGAFNTTEYGTVKDPEQFKALYAYSPYHHVRDGTAYPAVLFLTGDNDGRVDPANSRKMTARLQAATNSGLPILLRTDSNAGHGIGTGLSTRVSQQVDVFAFFFDQLGVEYKGIGLR